jgi:hypothetical protein
MASSSVNDTKLVLKYDDDKGNYTFKKFIPATGNTDLFDIARILNSFQDTPVETIVKVETRIIVGD